MRGEWKSTLGICEDVLNMRCRRECNERDVLVRKRRVKVVQHPTDGFLGKIPSSQSLYSKHNSGTLKHA